MITELWERRCYESCAVVFSEGHYLMHGMCGVVPRQHNRWIFKVRLPPFRLEENDVSAVHAQWACRRYARIFDCFG